NQNDISATGESSLQSNPPAMAPHHFHHISAFVTCGRGMQSIERVHHRRDRGIETEGHGRRLKIVVDRLWNAYATDSSLLQLQGGRHRAIAPDDDERFDARFI